MKFEFKKVTLYGLAGGVLSYILFAVIWGLEDSTDIKSSMLAATIVISVVISCCTGLIISKLDDYKSKEEETNLPN